MLLRRNREKSHAAPAQQLPFLTPQSVITGHQHLLFAS